MHEMKGSLYFMGCAELYSPLSDSVPSLSPLDDPRGCHCDTFDICISVEKNKYIVKCFTKWLSEVLYEGVAKWNKHLYILFRLSNKQRAVPLMLLNFRLVLE